MLEALNLKNNAETRYRCQVSVYRTIGPLVQVLYVLCSTRSRYQVSVYRTNGPLVVFINDDSEVTLTYFTARSNLET